jgi:RimJ/RimL family protein N-acetyltransferase
MTPRLMLGGLIRAQRQMSNLLLRPLSALTAVSILGPGQSQSEADRRGDPCAIRTTPSSSMFLHRPHIQGPLIVAQSSSAPASYLNEQRTRGWTKWRVQTPKGSMIGRAGFGAYGPNRELGYTLRSDSWGHGLATELALALVRWHTENPDPNGPPDLWAYAAVENIASRRVLEKVGFDFIDDRDHHGTSCAFYVFAHGPRLG